MDNLHLYTRITSLPSELRKEVADFVEFLLKKSKKKKSLKERKFGYAKGFFEISPDFDGPLDDFKEYL